MSSFEGRAAEKARPKRGNQYTKRRAQMDAEANAERWQDNPRYSAAGIMQRLADHAEGRVKLDATQIKSLELMLSRVAPTLSAVEQTVTDRRDTADPVEIKAKLRALYDQKPELFDFVCAAPSPQPDQAGQTQH